MNMTAFDVDIFDNLPPEGLYNVDIGLSEVADFGHLQIFADMNSDKYTDLVTVMGNSNKIQINTYDKQSKLFSPWKMIFVDGCDSVRSIAVGRSSLALRIFVTCSHSGSTYVKIVDR